MTAAAQSGAKLNAQWQLVPLKSLLMSMEQGWSPQCENRPAIEGEWGVLKVGCVNGDRFNPDQNKVLPGDLDPVTRYALRRDDVLISRANTRELVGSAARVEQDYPRLLLCDKLYRLRPDISRLLPEYLVYLLGSPLVRSSIEMAASGASSSMVNISQGTIKNLLIPLPTPAEQTAIATFLDRETARVDELLREQGLLLEELGLKRVITIRTAVTDGINATVQMQPSEHPWVHQIPQHWVPRKVSRSFQTIGSGTTPPSEDGKYYGGEIHWVNTGDLTDGPVGEVPKTVTPDALRDFSSLKIYPAGTLLMAMYGATIGKLGLLEIAACTNQACCAFVGGGELDTKFAFYWLMGMRQNIVALGYGGGQPNISQQTIRGLVIPSPPLDEQRAIVAFLDAQLAQIDALTEEVRASMDLMRQHRAALITAAVTGKIDVRNLV